MKRIPPDPDEVNERIADEKEIDEHIKARRTSCMPLLYCRHCGADLMGGTKCPERCTAGDEEPDAE